MKKTYRLCRPQLCIWVGLLVVAAWGALSLVQTPAAAHSFLQPQQGGNNPSSTYIEQLSVSVPYSNGIDVDVLVDQRAGAIPSVQSIATISNQATFRWSKTPAPGSKSAFYDANNGGITGWLDEDNRTVDVFLQPGLNQYGVFTLDAESRMSTHYIGLYYGPLSKLVAHSSGGGTGGELSVRPLFSPAHKVYEIIGGTVIDAGLSVGWNETLHASFTARWDDTVVPVNTPRPGVLAVSLPWDHGTSFLKITVNTHHLVGDRVANNRHRSHVYTVEAFRPEPPTTIEPVFIAPRGCPPTTIAQVNAHSYELVDLSSLERTCLTEATPSLDASGVTIPEVETLYNTMRGDTLNDAIDLLGPWQTTGWHMGTNRVGDHTINQYITEGGYILSILKDDRNNINAGPREYHFQEANGNIIAAFYGTVPAVRFVPNRYVNLPWGTRADDTPGWCNLPGELADHCKDPVELLPMWRWTYASNLWTDWGGNWFTSHVRAAIGGGFDLIVRILFGVAGVIWDITARLTYLALAADFSEDLLSAIDRTYYGVARAVIDSSLLYLVVVIGFIAAAWKIYREDLREAIKSLAWTMLPLGAVLYMFYSIYSGYHDPLGVDDISSRFEEAEANLTDTEDSYTAEEKYEAAYSSKLTGTPSWIHHKVLGITGSLADGLTSLSLKLSLVGREEHGSYCTIYNHQLERLYLQTIHDKNGRITTQDYSPIGLSRLWERAYLMNWGAAQFGSPQSAMNGSCLWAEYNTSGVSPPEVMAVWGTTCDRDKYTPVVTDEIGYGTSYPLYGCAADGHGVVSAIPSPGTQGVSYGIAPTSRAWRTFSADDDRETRSFVVLAAACNFISPNLATETSDSVPLVPPQEVVIVEEDGDTLFVRGANVFVETPKIGLRNNVGGAGPEKDTDEGEWTWFSADACRSWLTATNTHSSAWQKDQVGFEGGVVEGLTDDYTKDVANIECSDARKAAASMTEFGFARVETAPNSVASFSNADLVNQGATDVCISAGTEYFNRLLHGLLTLITAITFLFALVGLAAGTALAQILLALIFMFLPLILLITAVPTRQARAVLPRVGKIALGAALAHAMFLVILTLMILIIDVVSTAITNATDPGSTVRVIALAAIPFVAKKIVSGMLKHVGFDFTGFKNAVAVTSGLAAGDIGGRGGGRQGMLQRYGRGMMYSVASPYRMRSMLMGGRGARLNPSAALSGGAGAGIGAAGLGGALTGAMLGGGGGNDAGGTGVIPRERPASAGPAPTGVGGVGTPEPGAGGSPRAPQGATPSTPHQADVHPAAPPSAPYDDRQLYDQERTSQPIANRAAQVGKHLGKRGAGFTRRHMLMTAVVGGGLITGIGLPAIGVLYAGGKAMKMVTRGPRAMLTNKAKGIYNDQQAKSRELKEALYGVSGDRDGPHTPPATPGSTSRETHSAPETRTTRADPYEDYDPGDDYVSQYDPNYGADYDRQQERILSGETPHETMASRQPRPPLESELIDDTPQPTQSREPTIIRAINHDVPSRVPNQPALSESSSQSSPPAQTGPPARPPVRSPLADRQISLDSQQAFERIKAENKATDDARAARKVAESRTVRAQSNRMIRPPIE